LRSLGRGGRTVPSLYQSDPASINTELAHRVVNASIVVNDDFVRGDGLRKHRFHTFRNIRGMVVGVDKNARLGHDDYSNPANESGFERPLFSEPLAYLKRWSTSNLKIAWETKSVETFPPDQRGNLIII
jgi:hypothetical protein